MTEQSNLDATAGTANVAATSTDDFLMAQADIQAPVAEVSSTPTDTGSGAGSQVIIEVAEGAILRLPAGASIDQQQMVGVNLEFVQPDGSVIVVPNGAVQGLTIFIGDVEIPPLTVAALFEANGIQAAAGPSAPGSSGGNFEVPVGNIGSALPFGSLLAPTDLPFSETLDDTVNPANLPPQFGRTSYFANLSEEGLSEGNLDDVGADDSTNAVIVSGDLGAFDPNGDPLTFTFGQPAAGLTSNGLTITWTGVGTAVLIGSTTSGPVVVATISGATGSYSVTLLQPLDHPIAGIEDQIDLVLPITANDGQGGTATTSLTISVEDDSPLAGKPSSVFIDEDGLVSVNSDQDEGGQYSTFERPVGDSIESDVDVNVISATGTLGIRWGADQGDKGTDVTNLDGSFVQDDVTAGGRAVYFTDAKVGVSGALHETLTSNGLAITFGLDANGTKLVGSVEGGRVVIEISLSDEGSGKFNVLLFDNLDHALANIEDDINLTFNYTARDADGDTVGGTFSVVVNDDMPVLADAAPINIGLDEDDISTLLSSGTSPDGDTDSDGAASASGSLAALVNSGADNPVTFGFVSGAVGLLDTLGVTSHHDAVSFGLVDNVLRGTADAGGSNERVVFEFTLGSDGTYTIRLFDQVDHASGDGQNSDIPTSFGTMSILPLGLLITATDADGDSVVLGNQVTLTITDDVPEIRMITNDAVAIDETGGVLNDDNTASEAVAALFADVSGKGVDPDMGWIYARDDLIQSWVEGGADETGTGPGSLGTLTKTLTLRIADAASGLSTTEGEAIMLTLEDGIVVGRITGGAAAFAIHIDGSGNVSVAQFLSLHHPDSSNPDDSVGLNGKIFAVLSVEDFDHDVVTTEIAIGSKITFEDDAPELTVTAPSVVSNAISNGTFGDGFASNGNAWGVGSGLTGATAGDWTVSTSSVEGATTIGLERVGSGYLGAVSPTGSVMVDMEASPGNVQITQSISGLVDGETYELTFEIGESNAATDGSAALRVYWNGLNVGTFDPQSGTMQTISIVVEAGAANAVTFQEIGTAGDYTGTFLANVRLSNVIIIDETTGIQAGTDEVTGVEALFAGVNAGTDPDMTAQFAQGNGAIVNVAANFGADGAAAGGGLVYGFTLVDGTNSGVATTEGKGVYLYTDAEGRVLGVYDDDDNGVSANDKVAFALHIDSNGTVTVAQFVSLDHPDTASNNEGIHLAADTVLVTVTATDGDEDAATSSADISGLISFLDDGPNVSIADADLGGNGADSVDEGETIIGAWSLTTGTDGVAANDFAISIDGATPVAVALGAGIDIPGKGTLTINSNHTWSFVAANVTADTGFDFTLSATDGDGDTDTATLTISVLNTNEPPVIASADNLFVSDEGLAGANPDTTGTDDTTNSATDTGAVNASDTDLDDLTYTLDQPLGTLASGGYPIVWEGNGTDTLIGKADGVTIVTIIIDGSGVTHVELSGPIDHPDTLAEDDLDISVGVKVSDGLNTTSSSFTVTFEDDAPVANGDTKTVAEGSTGGSSDLVLIVDVSGSMDTVVSDTGGLTRLDLAISAVQQLLTSGSVDEVKIILFSGNATSTTWLSAADALTAIAAPGFWSVSGGGTNYDAALFDGTHGAVHAFDVAPTSDNTRTVVFMSDGQPSSGDGIGSADEATWIDFLETNDVDKSVAIGFGGLNDTNKDNLEPIAWAPGEAAADVSDADFDSNVIVVSDADLAGLGDILTGTVAAPVSGNILTHGALHDSFGADGGHILSIVIDGVTHSATDGNLVQFSTALGGSFSFDFANGDWSYTPPASVPDGMTGGENITYTLIDGDGDTASAFLVIAIPPEVSVTGTSVNEGDGADVQVFAVDLSHATASPIDLQLTLGKAGDTASGTTDYDSASLEYSVDGGSNWLAYSGSATIPAGTSQMLVRVDIVDNGTSESSEDFTLTVDIVSANTVNTTAEAQATIVDDDNQPPVLALNTLETSDVSGNYRDNFGTVAYNNSNGSRDWTGDSWNETNDNDAAGSGTIQITGGQLRLGDDSYSGGNSDFISRAINLEGMTTATLTFDYRAVIGSSSEDVRVQISNGVGGFTTILEIDGNSSSSMTSVSPIDISSWISATTTLRIEVESGLDQDEFAYIDNINIAYTGTAPSVVSQEDNDTSWTEGDAAISIAAAGPTITDGDDTQMSSATIVLTNAKAGDVLAVGSLPGGIGAAIDTSVPGVVTVTLSGDASLADYQAAIAAVTFKNTSNDPSPDVDRIINVTVTDDHGNVSNPATTTIDVIGVNDAPTANDDSVITNIVDGSPIHIPTNALTWNDTDPDNDPLSITGVSNPVNGTAGLGSVTFDPTNPSASTSILSANFSGNSANGFSYADGEFGGQNYTYWADGSVTNNALKVSVGDFNNYYHSSNYDDRDGGWSRTFSLVAPAVVTIQFDYSLYLSGGTDNNDDAKVLFSIDGTEYTVKELFGNNGSNAQNFDGHYSIDVSLPVGNHEIAMGAYISDFRSGQSDDEYATATFDNVSITTHGSSTISDGSVDYTVSDGALDDTANVSIHGVEGDTITATSDEGQILVGGDSDDFLIGGEGDDALVGGLGSDTMTGNGGADLFVVSADTANPGILDIITDYSVSDGDVVDLSELLNGIGDKDLVTDGYVNVVDNGGGDYTVQVDLNGGGDGFVTVADVTVVDGTQLSIIFDDNHSAQDIPLI